MWHSARIVIQATADHLGGLFQRQRRKLGTEKGIKLWSWTTEHYAASLIQSKASQAIQETSHLSYQTHPRIFAFLSKMGRLEKYIPVLLALSRFSEAQIVYCEGEWPVDYASCNITPLIPPTEAALT
jgi:hypothetical protein